MPHQPETPNTEKLITVHEASFRVFAHFGIDRMFGNPGSTELPMLKGLPFPYIMGLNEAVVMAMADGFSRASGRPALVNLHSSAGTGHALGNLFTAWKNNTPVLVTAGQQARSILPFDPFLFAERPTEFPQPYVKYAVEPTRAQDVPIALARALAMALTPPMGPTFVSIPVDDWDQLCTMPGLPDLTLRTLPDPAGIDRLAHMLNTTKNPALVLGTGVAGSVGGWSAAIALAEKCGASVWCAPYAARETFPENHPQFAGFLPAWRDRIRNLLASHDAILVVGAPVFTYHVEGDGPHWPPHAELMALSQDPKHLAALPGGGGVLGDIASGLDALVQKIAPRRFVGEIRTLDTPPAEMTAPYVLSRIAALRPAQSKIVEEAPTARGPMHANLPITIEGGFYTCASGGLGYGLPAAVGVALGSVEKRPGKVIAVLGDGSAMYAIQALFAAHKEQADVSFIILNNSGYAALSGFSAEFGMNYVPGCDLGGIDFVQLAKAQGLPARRIEAIDTLDDALAWSFAETGPSLLDVRIA